jgi:hypothetical protein
MVLAEVESQIVVDVDHVVPMTDGGRRRGIDYPVGKTQQAMEYGRRDGLQNRLTGYQYAVGPDFYLDHRAALLPTGRSPSPRGGLEIICSRTTHINRPGPCISIEFGILPRSPEAAI